MIVNYCIEVALLLNTRQTHPTVAEHASSFLFFINSDI